MLEMKMAERILILGGVIFVMIGLILVPGIVNYLPIKTHALLAVIAAFMAMIGAGCWGAVGIRRGVIGDVIAFDDLRAGKYLLIQQFLADNIGIPSIVLVIRLKEHKKRELPDKSAKYVGHLPPTFPYMRNGGSFEVVDLSKKGEPAYKGVVILAS